MAKENKWKKASFTVEAAYIVPLMLVFVAGLLGFTYFTHHRNWCRGAAYESVYYALQPDAEGKDRAGTAADRLKERIGEVPLGAWGTETDASEELLTLTAKTKSVILPELFGDLFTTETDASAAKTDAPALKKAEWILKYVKDLAGA